MPVRLRRSFWLKEKNQKQQTRDRKPNLYSNRAKGGVMQRSPGAYVKKPCVIEILGLAVRKKLDRST